MTMTTFKTGLLLTLSLLLTTTALLAQPGQRGQRNQGPPTLPDQTQIAKMVAEVEQTLALTASQTAQVSALYFAHFQEAQKAMDSGKVSRQTMEALKTDFEVNVEALLTKSQVKAFRALQKNQRPPQQQRNRR